MALFKILFRNASKPESHKSKRKKEKKQNGNWKTNTSFGRKHHVGSDRDETNSLDEIGLSMTALPFIAFTVHPLAALEAASCCPIHPSSTFPSCIGLHCTALSSHHESLIADVKCQEAMNCSYSVTAPPRLIRHYISKMTCPVDWRLR